MRLNCRCKIKIGRDFSRPKTKNERKKMKKIVLLLGLLAVVCVIAGCCKCENEPIVEANHKLIVPPNFGNMPK